MADRVRYNMDQMVGFFRKLEESQLFKPDEIKAIIKKRTDYEYVLMRRELSIQDVSNYLKYELSLDKLMEIRVKKLKASAKSLDNPEGVTRQQIHLLNSIRRKKSNALLDATLGKAIAMHPRESKFWILAATHELKVNKNFHSARVMMQRALRVNDKCAELWKHSFQLELWNLLRAIERQKLLINKNAINDSKEKILTEIEIEEELFGPVLVVFKYATLALKDSNQLQDIFDMHTNSIGVSDKLSELLNEQLRSIIFQNTHHDDEKQSELRLSYWKHYLIVKLKEYILTSPLIQMESDQVVDWSYQTALQFVVGGWKHIQTAIEGIQRGEHDDSCLVTVYDTGLKKLLEILQVIFEYHIQLQESKNDDDEESHDEDEIEDELDENGEEVDEEEKRKRRESKKDTYVEKVHRLLDAVNSAFLQSKTPWSEINVELTLRLKEYTLSSTEERNPEELSELLQAMIRTLGGEILKETPDSGKSSTTRRKSTKAIANESSSNNSNKFSFHFPPEKIQSIHALLMYHVKSLFVTFGNETLNITESSLNKVDEHFENNLLQEMNRLSTLQRDIQLCKRSITDLKNEEIRDIDQVAYALAVLFHTREHGGKLSATTNESLKISSNLKERLIALAPLLTRSEFGSKLLLNDDDDSSISRYSQLSNEEYLQIYWNILEEMRIVTDVTLRQSYIERYFELQLQPESETSEVTLEMSISSFQRLKKTFEKTYGLIQTHPLTYTGMDKPRYFNMVYQYFQEIREEYLKCTATEGEVMDKKKRKLDHNSLDTDEEMRLFLRQLLEKALENDTTSEDTKLNSNLYEELLKIYKKEGKIELANHLQYKRRRLLEE